MTFTILGATGFIGRHMAAHLQRQGIETIIPPRDVPSLEGGALGHVIYAIGLTGNFRQKPRETVDAHVTTLQRLLKNARFDSWTYLSSTRLYGASPLGHDAREESPVSVTPSADSLYDLSKMLGEAVCIAEGNTAIRIARLSNVYGAGQSTHSFLGSILQSLREEGAVTLRENPASAKDYVSIEDVCTALQTIALEGSKTTYNIASGENTTHAQIAQALSSQGYKVDFLPQAPLRQFPVINTARIKELYAWTPHRLTDDMPALLRGSKNS